MRKPIIAANWKMNKTTRDALDFIGELVKMGFKSRADLVICPPHTSLEAVSRALMGTGISSGAQNIYWEAKGAYTGEISAEMALSAGAAYCIIGHSERRALFGETDAGVAKKTRAALDTGLRPIICVGESLSERESGLTPQVIERQVVAATEDLDCAAAEKIVVAYEPVWAIGTGVAASADDAIKVTRSIRDTLEKTLGKAASSIVRIQYGGSVNAKNITDFVKGGEIDGALVGGASLDARSFASLIAAAYGDVR